MKKQKSIIIVISIITAIIIAGIILFDSNQEIFETQIEEKWNESGPFAIDKKQYNLGDKIFIDVEGLSPNDKGSMAVYRQLNNTHYDKYIEIPFDGTISSGFSKYLSPGLYEFKGMCSVNDVAGMWLIKLVGTEYPDIKFKIINQTNTWDNNSWDPIC